MIVQEVVKQKQMIYYVKIHVPWEVLSVYAELLSLRAPLQVTIYTLVTNSNLVTSYGDGKVENRLSYTRMSHLSPSLGLILCDYVDAL